VEPQSQFLEDIRDTEVRNLNSPIKSGESKASSTSELKSLVQQKDTVASELSVIPKTNYGLTRDDSNKPEPLENVLVEKTQVSVCNSKDLKYSVSFKNSCIGEINGEINIEEVQGGQLPYLFSIDNGVNYSKGSDFSGLGKGVYHVSVMDHLGCKSAQLETLQIIETHCEGQGKKEYIFNPSHNELVIQNTVQLSGVIEVYSYSGSEVFRKQFLNFESITWNGYGSNNILVQPGNYIFKISYSDNSMENGSITVTY
jgi:hypothetical protein